MPTTNVMTNCSKCQKKTLHIEQKMNHILHLLLSIVTAGVWIIVWVILAILHSNKPQCTICGHNKGLINDTIAEIKNTDRIVKPNKLEEDTREDIQKGNSDLRGFLFMVLIVIVAIAIYIIYSN